MLFFRRIYRRRIASVIPTGRRDFILHKNEALRIIQERLVHFNQYYKYVYTRVSVKNQKTRWGSCSRRGALSFNYRLAFLPEEIRDYVVVHELCHLGQFNHSPAFWKLVAETVPEYKRIRARLKALPIR